MAGKKACTSMIFPGKLTRLAIVILLLFCLPAAAQVIHENPDTVTPSYSESFDDQLNWLLMDMLGNLNDVSSALDNGNITMAREAYSQFSSSYRDFGDLLWQLNLSESDYRDMARQMNLTNEDIRDIIDASDAYDHGVLLYNTSLSAGDPANASIASARIRDSYANISSSYGSLRHNATLIEDFLMSRDMDTGLLDSSLSSLDHHMYQLNQSYSDLNLPEKNLRLLLGVDKNRTAVGDTIIFSGNLRDMNGMPISNASVIVYVDGRPVGTFITDMNGDGGIGYEMPVNVSGDHVLAHAEYFPYSSSGPFITSNFIELTLQDMPAVLSIRLDRDAASFGDTVNVMGELMAVGTGMPYRPIEIYNGSSLTGVSTDKNGSYSYAMRIVPSLPAGLATINATYNSGANDILLGASSGDMALSIVARSTNLTLSASDVASTAGTYNVYGYLLADNGVPVGGENISIYVDGSATGAFLTGDDGAYNASITLHNNSSSGNYSILALYDPGPGMALAGSSSAPLVVIFQPEGLPVDPLTIIVGAIILLIVIVATILAYRRYNAPMSEEAVMPEVPGPVERPVEQVEPSLDVLEESDRIRSTGVNNTREAMAQLYAISRKLISDRFKFDESLTHHELYNAAVAAMPSVSLPLKDIVALYEKAVFANRTITSSELDMAIGSLKELGDCIRETGR